MCKFTPLGFETTVLVYFFPNYKGVNLPRWGLKLAIRQATHANNDCVNLPRWGLKLVWLLCFAPGVIARVNLPRWGLKPLSIQAL